MNLGKQAAPWRGRCRALPLMVFPSSLLPLFSTLWGLVPVSCDGPRALEEDKALCPQNFPSIGVDVIMQY